MTLFAVNNGTREGMEFRRISSLAWAYSCVKPRGYTKNNKGKRMHFVCIYVKGDKKYLNWKTYTKYVENIRKGEQGRMSICQTRAIRMV